MTLPRAVAGTTAIAGRYGLAGQRNKLYLCAFLLRFGQRVPHHRLGISLPAWAANDAQNLHFSSLTRSAFSGAILQKHALSCKFESETN
jgi:hypothetical protein